MLVKRFPRLLKLLAFVAAFFLTVTYFTSRDGQWGALWLWWEPSPTLDAIDFNNKSLVATVPASTFLNGISDKAELLPATSSSVVYDAAVLAITSRSSISDDVALFTTSILSGVPDDSEASITRSGSSLAPTLIPSPTENVNEPGHSTSPTVSDTVQDQEYPSELPTAAPPLAENTSQQGNSAPVIVPETTADHEYQIDLSRHREVFAVSTPDRRYFDMYWGDNETYNPSIISHPTRDGQYLIVAQLEQDFHDYNKSFYVMACTADFVNGTLGCSEPPTPLPIAHTTDTLCKDAHHPGPHDPRLFYGPGGPFISYGSYSDNSCQGVWMQDLRHLVPEFGISTEVFFDQPTDVQRPPPYRDTEKNYFLFWDSENNTYVHHDLSPIRIFTPVYANGSVGPNTAPEASAVDWPCMQRYMPTHGVRNGTGHGVEFEETHQSTNSLAITLCGRSDPECHPTNDNTFIMVIFQHKSYYAEHSEYFPYVMLFQQTAPFAIHALSTKAIWIHGRTGLTQATDSRFWKDRQDLPTDQSEMFFVVSMSWKRPGQRYHGYIDDEIFLAFGIEDSRSAGIDILAGDLLQDLGYCSTARESENESDFSFELG